MPEFYKSNNYLVSLWVRWHFIEASKNLLEVWNNYFLFVLNYFSILLILKTFFSPWRKDVLLYPRGFNPKVYFEVFISNLFSRIIGAFVRFVLILIGFLSLTGVFILGLFIFLFWLLSPVLLLLGLFLSLWFLI